MCGIVGLHVSEPSPTLEASITDALSLMIHRGPDDTGAMVKASSTSGIGMARLRVRSSAADSVPFQDLLETNSYALNGEVYGTYRIQGQDYGRSRVEGGVDECRAVFDRDVCPDGMWALICLADDGSISVSRDPWGIKPLWLRTWDSEEAGNWMVASSLAAVTNPSPAPRVRSEAVAQFLTIGQVIDGGSLWETIRPLPPGARDASDYKGLQPEERLAPVRSRVKASMSSTADVGRLIRDALGSSVTATLESDRSSGLALSGGLDSTIIAHHAREMEREDLRTVSIRVEGSTDGIDSLADLPLEGAAPGGWEHHVRHIGPADYLGLLRRSVLELGEPTRLTSVPLYMGLSDAAAEAGIVVLVVGEGADEVWGGYRSYLDIDDSTSPSNFYLPSRHVDTLRSLVGPEAAHRASEALRERLPERAGGQSIREAERTFSLGPLLNRTDALMMANSIEARTPFLHGESWAIAGELPWTSLVGGGHTKLALRSAYADVLPHFRDERKVAFRAPWERWLATELAEEVTEILRSGAPNLDRLGVNSRTAQEVVSRGIAGDSSAASHAFSLCTLAIWAENFDDA